MSTLEERIRERAERARQLQTGTSVIATATANSQAAASANRIGRDTGLPADVVERNTPEIEARIQARQNADRLRTAPAHAQDWFADPRNAAAGKDDVEPLVSLSKYANPTLKKWLARPAPAPKPAPVSGAFDTATDIASKFAQRALVVGGGQITSWLNDAWSTVEDINNVVTSPIDAAMGALSQATGIKAFDPSAKHKRQEEDRAARTKMIETRLAGFRAKYAGGNPISEGVLQGGESILPSAAATAFGGLGAALTLGGLVGNQAYQQDIRQGMDPARAFGHAITQGVPEAAFEIAPETALAHIGEEGLKGVGKFFATELPGEMATTLVQSFSDWVYTKPDQTFGDWVNSLPEAEVQTALGVLGGGVVAPLALGANKVGQSVVARQQVRARRRIFAEAVKTRSGGAILDDIMDSAAATQMREHDPEGFRRYVEGLSENTAIENVFIPAEAVRELMQDAYRDDPFWGKYADQIDEASALEGDVVIPLSDVAAHLAGTPEWAKLREEARFSPGGMSEAELKSLQESYAKDQEIFSARLKEEMDRANGEASPTMQVYQDIRNQLQNAGYRPDVADAYAQFWAMQRETRGQALGQTAAEYHAANPVEFRRVLPEALSRSIQPADGLDIVIGAMRGKEGSANRGASLLDFIAKQGGVEDRGGDIASMGGDKWHRERVGRRKLLKPFVEAQGSMIGGDDTNSIESVFHRAVNEGYFPDLYARQQAGEKLDTNDFLAAIGDELRGSPVYAGAPDESETARLREAGDELRQVLNEAGIDPDTATRKEIEAALEQRRKEASNGGLEQSRDGRSGEGRGKYAPLAGSPEVAGGETRNPVNVPQDGNETVEDAQAWAQENFGFDLAAHGWERTRGPESVHSIVRTPAFADASRAAGYDAISMQEDGKQTWGALDRGSVTNPETGRTLYQDAFYSALERAAEGISATRAPAQQWIATLKKSPGVKEEELEWSGVLDWLAMQTGPVEKDAVLQVIRDGGIKVEEVVLGDPKSRNERSEYLLPSVERALRGADTRDEAIMQLSNDSDAYRDLQRYDYELFYANPDDESDDNYNEDWAANVVDSIYPDGFAGEPKFSNWTSDPDNPNSYRELLITLPLGEGGNPERAPSTHWDQEGVVAHTRFMDKKGPNGERILFVEEVQSDWHQKGRDQGYQAAPDEQAIKAAEQRYVEAEDAAREAGKELAAIERKAIAEAEPLLLKAYDDLVTSSTEAAKTNGMSDEQLAVVLDSMRGSWGINFLSHRAEGDYVAVDDLEKWLNLAGIERTPQLQETIDAARAAREKWHDASGMQGLRRHEWDIARQPRGIPDAPFKSSWPALVMKRLIVYAAENGYDQVAWTTGEQQAERYNLSQEIGTVEIARGDGQQIRQGMRVEGKPDRYLIRADNDTAIIQLREHFDTQYGAAGGIYLTADQVREAFGTDLGNRMVEAADAQPEGGPQNYVEFAGEDLKIGGEGMKAFYDRNLVNITNKIIKKYGAKVEMVGVTEDKRSATGKTAADYRSEIARIDAQMADPEMPSWERERWQGQREMVLRSIESLTPSAQQPGFAITPELRDAAKEGFALFQGGHQPRGRISGGLISGEAGPAIIELFGKSDLSTVIHESAHLWLEEFKRDAALDLAPQWMKDDWATVEKWFAEHGQPVTADGHIPTEAHEMWARGVERHAMEGKSPSAALARVFAKFRGWLLTLYKHVNNLNSPITPDIRRVMDRMLATQEAIDDAAERQQLHARFANAQQAGMTEAEFAAYRQTADEARSEAFDALLYRTMANIRAERTKAWKEETARVRDEVTTEVNRRPEFRALHLLRTGRFLDDPERAPQKVKLDRGWLVERFGEDALAMLPKGVPPIYGENGDSADIIAELAGFRAGDEMVLALMGVQQATVALRAAGDKRSVRAAMIDDETDQRMADRHGDPLNDGSIEDEALAAIHNEKEGELIATENRALARQSRQQPTPYSMIREWARGKIASGRVVDVASRAALQRYARAAAKAGKAFETALAEGNVEEAFNQSEIRLINHALIAEASKAADRIDTIVARLGRVAKQPMRKSVDQDYFERAQALLAKFEFRSRSQKTLDEQESFADWAAARQAEGFDVVTPPRLESDGVHYSRMAVEELFGLDESVSQILHLGRLKKSLLDGQEQREFDALVDETDRQGDDIGRKPPKSSFADPSRWESLKARVASMDAALLKMEQVIDWLDNGNPNGVFNRIVFRPLAEAQAREQTMTKEYHNRLADAAAKVPPETVRGWANMVTLDLIDRETGLPASLPKQKIVAMALNWGNEGNRQRLADGFGWNPQGVEREFARHMSAEEWGFVQETWDIINDLWPDIEAMERRINGVAPEKVEASAFEINVGEGDEARSITLKGGYYPAIYDTTLDYKAEERAGRKADLFETNYIRATTRASATKDRSEKVKRPILLDLGVIQRHVGEVIHDITHREPVMNAHKFLTSSRVQRMIDDTLGREIRQQFRPWLNHIANAWATERAGNEGLGKFFSKLRANTTVVGMGFRFSTMMAQVAGYSNSVEFIGAKWVADGIARFSAHPHDTFEFVVARSAEMKHRIDTLDRDIRTELTRMAQTPLQKSASKLTDAKKFAFHGIGYMDRVVSIPTWLGAYNRAISEGMSEDEAGYFADKAIRLSQGAAGAKDLAAVQRGQGRWGEALKLMTMFYSYLSTVYNRQRNLGREVRRASAKELPGLMARAWWLVAVPPILAELLSGRGPDDDEEWGWWAFKKMMSQSLGAIPGVRDLWEPLWDRVAGNHAFDYRFTPAQGVAESAQRVAQDARRVATGDETKRATRDVLELSGYATGFPPGQVAATVQFFVDLGYGEADPQTASDWYQGITKGKIEEE